MHLEYLQALCTTGLIACRSYNSFVLYMLEYWCREIRQYVWIMRRNRRGSKQEGLWLRHTTWMFECFVKKERCMGMPESTPSHKTNEHTRGRLTYKARKFDHLCEKERCIGKPEATPCDKMNKSTRGRLTHKTRTFKHLCKKESCMGKAQINP